MGLQSGKFLKEAREDKGVSQAELASRLGLKTAQSISNIERGLAPIPQFMIAKICKLLNVEREAMVEVIINELRQKYLGKSDSGSKSARALAFKKRTA